MNLTLYFSATIKDALPEAQKPWAAGRAQREKLFLANGQQRDGVAQ
ncbi:hypothetical protein [Azotobacter chroococcum]|nr:hypothetical protein [Azotobacter chroococcum]